MKSDLIDLADQLMDLVDSCEGAYEFCKRSSLFRESKRSGFALGRAVVAGAVVTKICRILFKNDLKEPLPVVGRQRLFNVPDAEGGMTMDKLDEKGWIFLGNDKRPYWVRMWGGAPWVFRWHDHQKSFIPCCKMGQQEAWEMPDNLSKEQQNIFRKYHELSVDQSLTI